MLFCGFGRGAVIVAVSTKKCGRCGRSKKVWTVCETLMYQRVAGVDGVDGGGLKL